MCLGIKIDKSMAVVSFCRNPEASQRHSNGNNGLLWLGRRSTEKAESAVQTIDGHKRLSCELRARVSSKNRKAIIESFSHERVCVERPFSE